MKFTSLRWRLVVSYILFTVLTVSLIGLLTLTLLQRFISSQTDAQLKANALAIARQAETLMSPDPNYNQLLDLARSLSFLGRVRVRILDDQFKVVVDSGKPEDSTSVVWIQSEPKQKDQLSYLVPLESHQNDPKQPWIPESVGAHPSFIVRVEEDPWGRRVMFLPVSELGNAPAPSPKQPVNASGQVGVSLSFSGSAASVRVPIGSASSPLGYVQLDSPRTFGTQVLNAMRQALLVAALISAGIGLVAGLGVSHSLTAPILTLADRADRMSSGDLSVRAPVRGAGEIAQLARQFNHMAERLQASFNALSSERDTLRRFMADASHELRTPVTALGNFIELLQGPAAEDVRAREEFLAECQAQVQRMEWITSNLLNLSRLDAGLVQLDCQTQDLGSLLQSAAMPFFPRAKSMQINFEVIQPDIPMPVVCDRARMEIALGNLLSNALKFTPADGKVTMRGDYWDGHIRIQVKDTGCGIAPEDLPRVFERFYRGRTTRDGSGLGLSIAQGIIQAHQGEIIVKSEAGKGCKFTVLLPLPENFVGDAPPSP
jgi:signal transduction histidine kinase